MPWIDNFIAKRQSITVFDIFNVKRRNLE